MGTREDLGREYWQLLAACGVQISRAKLDPADVEAAIAALPPAMATGARAVIAHLASGDLDYDTVFGVYRQQIEAALAHLGTHELRSEVLIAEYPRGRVNAQSRRSRSGVLVLVDSGLVKYVIQMCMLAGHLIPWTGVSDRGNSQAQSPYEEADLVEAASKLTAGYALRQWPQNASVIDDLHVTADTRHELVADLAHYSVVSVLAHEYGHIVHGHLERPAAEAEPGARWGDEFAADQTAMDVILAIAEAQPDHRRGAIAAAPLMAFSLVSLVDSVRQSLHPGQEAAVGGHPPLEERSRRARSRIALTSNDEALALAGAIEAWAQGLAPQVLEWIGRAYPDVASPRAETE